MRRRTVLATLGTFTAALAGCTDSSIGGPNTDGTMDTPDDGEPTATDGGSADGSGSRFAGEPCPSFTDNADRTVCSHTLGDESAPLRLEPSTELFEPSVGDNSVETMTFTLHNGSGGGVGLNPYNWTIRRQTADGWERVAPEMYPEPWFQLDDEQTYRWVLSVEEHPTPDADRTRYPMVDLDDGVYSFEVTVAAEEGPNSGERTECVALFEVRRE